MDKLLVERVSQRAIVRLTGVARMTVTKLAKKAATTPRHLPPPSRPRELELDEMWTFVGRKQRKVWLWRALPVAYRTGTWYYTDEWAAYRRVLPPAAHRPSAKGSGRTSIVEAVNCSLRQRCAVLVRKSCSFSRSLAMHRIRLQLCIDDHNDQFTLN